jgi:recombination protein RecR
MYTPAVQELIDELGRLPGVGPKSAQRIAFHLLKQPGEDVARLAVAIDGLRSRVSWCPRCYNIADVDPAAPGAPRAECAICADPRRDPAVICVVEDPKAVVTVERTGGYRGRYHVLQGLISPIDGVGAEQLRIRELLARLGPEGVGEVLLCFSPTHEGETTAMYLAREITHLSTPEHPVRVTQPASGLPFGGDLDYADEITLGRALAGRREVAF